VAGVADFELFVTVWVDALGVDEAFVICGVADEANREDVFGPFRGDSRVAEGGTDEAG
jgi:hypothetical protein